MEVKDNINIEVEEEKSKQLNNFVKDILDLEKEFLYVNRPNIKEKIVDTVKARIK